MSKTELGIIGIIVKNRESASQINEVLHRYSGIIVGRLGIPYHERSISIISVAVDGSPEDVSSLTSDIAAIPGVSAKSVITED